jgi:TonB family protein
MLMSQRARSHVGLSPFLIGIAILILVFSFQKTHAATSDWLNQPKPAFPAAALQKNAEGAVRLRVTVDRNGNVTQAVIIKSSGNKELDEAAQRGVLSWKMKRGAIKPADLAQGRNIIVDFKEEAAVAARYPGGVSASFGSANSADMWRSAPFPSYPMEARMRHEEGTVRVKVKIGSLGNVTEAGLLQSSGHKVLDDAAIVALRHWKAHPRYAGQTVAIPIQFTMRFR